MKLIRLIEFLRARLKTVIWLCLGILIAVGGVDALLVDKHHAHTSIEKIPFFWAGFGFLACVAIILLSKWFGHAGIMTREDYYDE